MPAAPHAPNRFRRARRLLLFTLVAMILVALVGGVSLARWRALALVHPARSAVTQTPADYGIPDWEDITLATADGLTLPGWFVQPVADAPTIVFVHGYAGNRGDLLPLAGPLVAEGYGALLFDLRNHGESDGDLTTLGYYEVRDVQAALAFLQTRPAVNPDQLALVGHSMGAGTVLRAAARLPEVRAVAAISGFSSLEDNVADAVFSLTGLPPFPFAPLVVWFGEQEAGAPLSSVRPVDDMTAIAPRPVLLVHGAADPLLNPANSERLYAAAADPRTLLLLPGTGHSDAITAPETLAALRDFLAEALGD
jgi:pimeloyl-ACP methyl ester carboxylesterase